MASSKQVLLLAAVVAVACLLPSLASARQWVVGDECGWKARFNHTHWANGKTFVVGDTLRTHETIHNITPSPCTHALYIYIYIVGVN
jgi:hypothetical protein